MNEASPRILEGLKNLVSPDVRLVVDGLREKEVRAEQMRHEAPVAVARAAEWILANSEEICDVVSAGVSRLPMSRPMLIEAFHNCVSRWTDTDRLRTLIREETLSLNVGRPIIPEVVFHNLAGNLFLSGWESITHAALLGATSLVRCSEHDRVFPAIWAYALTTANPLFLETIAICEWPANDSQRFRQALELCDAAVCFGSDESVQSLRHLTPWNKPFAGHGSTVSFSLLTADELRNNPVEWLAEGCAYDFAVYDQQGCLSPRALFVEDLYSRDVDRFVDSLHSAMKLLEKNLPRASLTLEDQGALARARDTVLLDAACGGAGRRVSTNSDPFLLTVKAAHQFSLGPVNRYVDVYLYKQLSEVEELLRSFRGRISTLSLADPRRPPGNILSVLQVKRACELGNMQIPPLAWCLDGLRPIQKMLRFQTIQLP